MIIQSTIREFYSKGKETFSRKDVQRKEERMIKEEHEMLH